LWLLGISRDLIARSVGIECGSVSRIIDEIRSKEVPDLDLLRAIAKKIKGEGLDWTAVASYTRFSNTLEQIGLSEKDLEILILHIESHCFKTNQNIHDFVDAVNENFKFASELGVSIYEVFDSIEHKKQELQTLENELKRCRILIQKHKIEYQKIHGRLPDFL
jgi:DNA repair ATPase RecN